MNKTNKLVVAEKVNEYGLNETEQKNAELLQLQHPNLYAAAKATLVAAQGFSRNAVELVSQLRASKLAMPEARLLLRSAGFIKQRITTFARLMELESGEFTALEEGKLTVAESVAIVRAKNPKKAGGAKKGKKKPYALNESQCTAMPEALSGAVESLAEAAAKALAGVGAFKYLLKKNGRMVRVFVSID